MITVTHRCKQCESLICEHVGKLCLDGGHEIVRLRDEVLELRKRDADRVVEMNSVRADRNHAMACLKVMQNKLSKIQSEKIEKLQDENHFPVSNGDEA